jgi:hypothetical protein
MKCYLNKTIVDYRRKRTEHVLAINNTRISKCMSSYQAEEMFDDQRKNGETNTHDTNESGMTYILYHVIIIVTMTNIMFI